MENLSLFLGMNADIIIRLLMAMLLGMILGLERLYAHKTASMRTYALVSMGAALFVMIGQAVESQMGSSGANANPLALASQIVTGIGFLGAGMIIFRESKLTGLTTATGIWVSAGIGMAAGFGFFKIAILATILTIFIFTVLWFIEQKLKKIDFFNNNNDNEK